jgi:hypothetical protein
MLYRSGRMKNVGRKRKLLEERDLGELLKTQSEFQYANQFLTTAANT